MAKDLIFAVDTSEIAEGVRQDARGKSTPAAAKLLKVWENRQAQQAARVGGLGLMAVSLAACGGSSSETSATVPTTPVTSYALTNGTDAIVGSSSNDTISAAMVWSPGGDVRVNSLQSDDAIDGGAGTDTLNITADGGAANIALAPRISNVEVISLTNAGTTEVALNLGVVAGESAEITRVNVTSNAGDVEIRGLESAATVVKLHDVSDNATAVAIELDSTPASGSADAFTIELDGFDGFGFAVGDGAAAAAGALTTGAGVETLTIRVAGGASTINSIASQDLVSVVIDADAALTITNAAFDSVSIGSIDASASSAAVSINVENNIAANVFAFVGGAGNDTLISETGFTGTDSLNGGNGTDTLSIRPLAGSADIAAVGALSAADAAVATNWEVLDMRSTNDTNNAAAIDFTVDMDHLPGVTSITMRASDDDTGAVFTINDATATQMGALSLTLASGAIAGANTATVNIAHKTNTTSDAVVLNVAVGADDQRVLLNDGSTGDLLESATVNLSGAFSSVLDVEATAFLTSLTVTGGAAGETLTTATAFANATVNMSGVASDITFTTGGGTQTVSTGSGDDTITLNAGAKTVNLGAGDDTLVTGADGVGATDSLNGGAGEDTLHVEAALTDTGTRLSVISGFEILHLDPGAAQDPITMTNFVNNTGFTRIDIDDAGGTTIDIDNVSSSLNTLRLLAGAAGETVEFSRLVDLSADSLTISARAAINAVTALTVNDEETISISGSAAASDLTITTLNAADLTALTISGAADIVITNPIVGSTALATVNASTATGAVTVNASNSTVAVTATGNASAGNTGVFTFTGGAAADIITGGNGADILSGAGGADTISGGAGADQITGGGGNDVLTGGTGADIFVFEATGAANGTDSITDFAVGTGGDVLNLDAGLAAGATVQNTLTGGVYASPTADALATEGTSIAVNNQVIIINSGGLAATEYDTAAEVVALLADTGAWDAVDFATSQTSYILAAANNGTSANLWQVTNDGTAAIVAGELSLVATITFAAADGIDGLLAANFDLV